MTAPTRRAYAAAARAAWGVDPFTPDRDLIAPIVRAAVDAVWSLAVAAGVEEGRRQAAAAIVAAADALDAYERLGHLPLGLMRRHVAYRQAASIAMRTTL